MNHMQSYRSEAIDLIMGALANAQGCYRKLIPNEDSIGGKYANLTSVLEAVREPLAKNGLGFYQYIDLLDEGSGASLLRTMLGHSSGQYISSVARIIPGKTFRETFNSIEGFRRLHALLILGIAPSANDPLIRDDNGVEQAEASMVEEIRKPQKDKIEEKAYSPEVINKDQYTDLMYELDGYEDIANGIQKFYNIPTIADMPRNQYHIAIAKIRKIKKTHEEFVAKK